MIRKDFKRAEFEGIDESKFTVQYSNLGEPFREGVMLSISDPVEEYIWHSALLDERDAHKLRSLLDQILDISKKN